MLAFIMKWFTSPRQPSAYDLFKAATRKVDINDHPETKDAAVEALVKYIESDRFKLKRICNFIYLSNCCCVRAERDIHGPEIKLLNGHEMVDCRPAYYNLTREQATLIYDAICKRIYGLTINDD
uniref:Uncharacterized protein n=1 Tax=Pseudomonas phage Cygsa01 TaxID=3138529 RepID=A0AAU6W3W3_9VIRU